MLNVLLVEDEEITRRLTEKALKHYGFSVSLAMNGLEAVEAAKTEPDVILMDLGLPGIDGFEAIRRLKAECSTHGIPIIAVTAHAGADEVLRAVEAGCDDYETKPVSPGRLAAKILSLAQGKR